MSEFGDLGFREQMYGPELHSLWLHVDSKSDDRSLPIRLTIIEIQGWSRYGAEEEGSIEVHYYSLNGTTNNREYSDTYPESLRNISIDGFWSMVESGELVYLEPRPHTMTESQPIFEPGTIIEGIES
jgi:hypothetical protein